jgi:hypothetical protein
MCTEMDRTNCLGADIYTCGKCQVDECGLKINKDEGDESSQK